MGTLKERHPEYRKRKYPQSNDEDRSQENYGTVDLESSHIGSQRRTLLSMRLTVTRGALDFRKKGWC